MAKDAIRVFQYCRMAEKKVVPRRVDSKLVKWVISRRERISPEDGS
jgi:hypothetical protein